MTHNDLITALMDLVAKEKRSALERQIDGQHYKNFAIQPVEFIHLNKLGFLEGCVVKRVCRWRDKDGIKDLKKAIHELELLIELEEKDGTDGKTS